MTDKRPGNGFNYIQPRRKIQKLDVSIVAGSSQSGRPPFVPAVARAGSSTSGYRNVYPPPLRPPVHQPQHHQAMRPPPARAPPPQPPPSSEDMWGDDDDDFIISQAAEKAENCNPQQLLNALDCSTTFGDFQRNHRTATGASTQMPQVAAPVAAVAVYDELTDDAVLREFRSSMGGEDDVFSEVPDFDQIDDVNKHINEYLNNDQNTLVQQQQLNNFSSGSAGSVERSGGTAVASKNGIGGTASGPARQTSGGSSSDGGPAGATANNKYMQNVENAREIRLKFLSAQLADRQRETEQLQSEVTKLNERCQTKDGEIAMIRYDLQLNKKIQTDLRQDKLAESERIKGEYAVKLAELERTNSGHNAEIDFMRLEILNLKSRRLHDTTISSQHHPGVAPAPKSLSQSAVATSRSAATFRLHLTQTPTHMRRAPSHLFQQPETLPYGTHRPPNSLSDQLTTLQLLAARLDTAVASPSAQQTLLAQILSVTTRSLRIMQLDCAPLVACHANDGRPDNFLHMCDDPLTLATRSRLLAAASMSAAGELFDDESLPVGRRIVACLAAIAARCRRFCELMFASPTSAADQTDNSPVDRLTKMFQLIGVSTKWRQYLGLIEATAELLLALGQHYKDVWCRPLQQLLHALLVCRPSGRALGRIAAMLRTLSAADCDFLPGICRHSSDFALLSEDPRRVQFSPTSCTVQLLAVWLQAEFEPFAESVAAGRLRLLADVTLDTLRLVQNGVDRPLEWMVRQPTTAADEAGGARREESGAEDMCLCYAQLVCAGVVLMHLCVQEWIRRPRKFDMKTIVAIAQTGSIFISDHFTLRYESLVLRVGGPAIKQRLHVTFAWLQQYQHLLQFERVHQQALLGSNNLRGVRHMFELLNGGHDEDATDGKDASSSAAAATGIWSEMLGTVKAWREAPAEHDPNESDDDLEPAY